MLTRSSFLFTCVSLLFMVKAQVCASSSETNNIEDTTIIPHDVDVVIVGAGWAGLSAAAYLTKNYKKKTKKDLNLAVLEVNDYIGGRSKTEYFSDGTPIDMGSHKLVWHEYDLITTTNGVVVNKDENQFSPEGGALYAELEIVKNKCSGADHITSVKVGDDTGVDVAYKSWNVYHDRLKLLDKDRVNNLQKKVWLDGFLVYEKEMTRKLTTNSDISVETVLQSYLSSRKTMKGIEKRFLYMMIRSEIQGTYGGNLRDTSALTSAAGKGILSEPYKYDYGNGTVVSTHYDETEYMQGNFGAFATAYAHCDEASGNIAKHIYLENTVTEIRYDDDDGVMIKYKTKTGVTKQMKSRFVIVTVPLGVLKSGSIEFIPPLPNWKQKVINNSGFGTLDKWIEYWHNDIEVPWTNDTFRFASLLTNKTDINNNYNLFYNGYPIHNNKKILVGYMSGDEAADMELRRDEEIKEKAMSALRKMFPRDSVPEPTEFKISRWATNPNFKGAYYLNKPGRKQSSDAKLLSRPIANNRLFFAGEACISGWYGLTQGAFLSGRQVAKDLINIM